MIPVHTKSQGFPCGSAGKESACSVEDLGSIPGLERSPGEEKGKILSYSGLENAMDCIVHGVSKSWTRMSNFHFQSSTLSIMSKIPEITPGCHCRGRREKQWVVLFPIVPVSPSPYQALGRSTPLPSFGKTGFTRGWRCGSGEGDTTTL